MKTKTIIPVIICVIFMCCLIVHRRVIKALIKREPMPKAPKWHFWVSKKGRRE